MSTTTGQGVIGEALARNIARQCKRLHNRKHPIASGATAPTGDRHTAHKALIEAQTARWCAGADAALDALLNLPCIRFSRAKPNDNETPDTPWTRIARAWDRRMASTSAGAENGHEPNGDDATTLARWACADTVAAQARRLALARPDLAALAAAGADIADAQLLHALREGDQLWRWAGSIRTRGACVGIDTLARLAQATPRHWTAARRQTPRWCVREALMRGWIGSSPTTWPSRCARAGAPPGTAVGHETIAVAERSTSAWTKLHAAPNLAVLWECALDGFAIDTPALIGAAFEAGTAPPGARAREVRRLEATLGRSARETLESLMHQTLARHEVAQAHHQTAITAIDAALDRHGLGSKSARARPVRPAHLDSARWQASYRSARGLLAGAALAPGLTQARPEPIRPLARALGAELMQANGLVFDYMSAADPNGKVMARAKLDVPASADKSRQEAATAARARDVQGFEHTLAESLRGAPPP